MKRLFLGSIKESIYLLLVTLTLISVKGHASDDPKKFGENISQKIEKLPMTLRRPLATYMEIIRPSQYNSDRGSDIEDENPGIVDHFREMMNEKTNYGQCLNLKTQLFYSALKELEPEEKPANVVRAENEILPTLKLSPDDSPNLLSTTEDYGQSAGWVWRKALQIAAGNPNDALRIIGFCGHDDFGPIDEGFDLKNIDQKMLDSIESKFPDSTTNIGKNFECPSPDSAFFAPASLGSNADISQDLKQRIHKLQAAGQNSQNSIAAKYYHVYASAYIGCRMVENGVSASLAPLFASKFASVYRRTVICRASGPNRQAADRINSDYQKALATQVRSGNSGMSITNFLKSRSLQECERMLEGSEYKNVLCVEDRRKNLSPEQFDKITAILFAGKMYFEQQQCPRIEEQSSFGIKEMMRFASAIESNAFDFGKEFNCENIPQSICDSAQKILAAWKIDFEWTMSQHRTGAAFGAKSCHSNYKPQPEISCEVPAEFFSP